MRKGMIIIGLATVLSLVFGVTAFADVDTDLSDQRCAETLLEGDTLDQVVAAALAVVGEDASVVRAETDADGNAAYEVHMVRPDGTLVTVYVDESFAVVSVVEEEAQQVWDNRVDGKNDGTTNPWGEHRTDEILLEGDVLNAVVAAALAEVGEDAKVLRAETDADGHATYEVHLLTADGRLVTVYVDESYAVFSVAENATPGAGWMGVLRGKLKVRDQDGEKIKNRNQVREETESGVDEDQSHGEDEDAGEGLAKGHDKEKQDNSRGGSKRGGSQQ